VNEALTMAPKKKVKDLPRKAVPAKKAEAVKGGRAKQPRIALNHNQSSL
jgi:hypothetical protein